MRFGLFKAAVAALAVVGTGALVAGFATSRTGSAALATAVEAAVPSTLAAAPSAVSVSVAAGGSSANSPAASTVTPQRPAPVNHCAGNATAQFAEVSIHDQHMWLCHFGTLVFETAVTTGASAVAADDATPTGTFHIQGRDRDSVLTLNTGQRYDVKYWIPFNAPLYGFHDSSWQKFPYGSPLYTTQGSHGCVHMPLHAIQFFYSWVQIGATVHISA